MSAASCAGTHYRAAVQDRALLPQCAELTRLRAELTEYATAESKSVLDLTADERRLLLQLREGLTFVCKPQEEPARALIYGPILDGKSPLTWPSQARVGVESLFRLELITEATTKSFLSGWVLLSLTPKGWSV